MHFFLLLSIPAAIVCLISSDSEYSFKKLSTPLFIGCFIGIIFSAFNEFFLISEGNSGSSFFSIIFSMTTITLIPTILLTALFLFFSKDVKEYKIYSVLPLLSAFYSIYIPYMTLTQWEKNSFFMNFISPVIYIETITLFSCILRHGIKHYGEDKKKTAMTAAAAFFSLLLHPILYSFWYLKIFVSGAYIMGLLLLPFSIFAYKFYRNR